MNLNICSPTKLVAGTLIFLNTILFGCSALTGGSSSNDPTVIAQEQQVKYLEDELKEQDRRTDEAEQLYKRERDLLKAKKSELKAAKRLLSVYKKQADNR